MKLGASLVALAGAAMIVYGVVFLIRNFTAFTDASFGIRAGRRCALWSALIAPGVALVIALPIHHVYDLATFGHVGSVYLAMALILAGAVLSLKKGA
jgi:hypothetical protein